MDPLIKNITDLVFEQWTVKDIEIMLAGAVIGDTISRLTTKLWDRFRKSREGRRQLEYLWREYLTPFCEEDFQGLLGACGGLSDYDLQAAKRLIVPATESMLETLHGKQLLKSSVKEFLTPDPEKNLIIHGDYEPSEMAETLLYDEQLPYYTGLKIDSEYLYEISNEHIKRIRQGRTTTKKKSGKVLAAGETFIAHREKRVPVYEPVRRDDHTYASDAVVITFTKSYWNRDRWILGLAGVREMGTYLSGELLTNPRFISDLLTAMVDRGVRAGDSFQAVVEFILDRYKLGTLPPGSVIYKVRVIDVVPLK